MIKVSKLTDYAVVVVAILGAADKRMNTQEVAEKSGLPEPTVAKVLKVLSKAKLAHSTQGPHGGYTICCDPNNVSVLEVVEAIEGKVNLTSCVGGVDHVCNYETCCPIRGRWDGVNGIIEEALEAVKLADMIQSPFAGKKKQACCE